MNESGLFQQSTNVESERAFPHDYRNEGMWLFIELIQQNLKLVTSMLAQSHGLC